MPTPGGVDLATLGIRVDATEVRAGTSALRDLETQGSRTERRFITLAEYDRQREQTSRVLNRALRERAQTEREVAALMNQTATATGNVAQKSRLAGAPIARLNNSMVVLARRAAGAHPVVGQLADAVGTFAIGTAKMVPILAGLAAIAGAIRLIGREARETKERIQEAQEVLDRLAPDNSVQESVVEIQRRFDRNLIAYNRLTDPEYIRQAVNSGLATPAGLARDRQELFDSLLADQQRIARGQGQISEDQFQERMDRLRENLRDATGTIERDLAAFDRAFNAAQERQAIAEQSAYSRGLTSGMTGVGVFTAPGVDRTAFYGSDAFRKAAEEQQLLVDEMIAREEDLQDARVRANDALIRSLENVGRAYGGVVDQIIALTAATFNIWQNGPLPGFGNPKKGPGFGDAVRGYGTAALTGIGFGASTGDPILGGIGGGLAGGFATGGPGGAIIGAVGGIVSGLIESGRRAREAQRIWRNSLEAFDRMFDNLTPFEQDIAALDDAFQALSGGRTVAEVEQAIADLRRLQEQYFDPTGAIDEAIQRNEELLRIYRENAEQARELAEAERELYDARFTALNSPSGYNLAYRGYQAGFGSSGGWQLDGSGNVATDQGGYGPSGDVTINVYGTEDPEETARQVVREWRRQARRGAGDPTTFASR